MEHFLYNYFHQQSRVNKSRVKSQIVREKLPICTVFTVTKDTNDGSENQLCKFYVKDTTELMKLLLTVSLGKEMGNCRGK